MRYFRTSLLAVIGLAVSTAGFSQGMPPASVVIGKAELRELSPAIDVPGTVVSRFDARLASELAAKLEWIAEVGTRVEKGDAVARLDDITFELAQMEAESRVSREQARVTFLASEKARLERLESNNLSARSQLEQVSADLSAARSDEAIARAQLGQAKVAMAVTQILAPFDGIVAERFRNIGERLNVADEVVRLVDPESLEIVARAPLNTVHFVSEGDELSLHNDYRDDSERVRTIVPFGNPQSHMFEVRLTADPAQWTVGESVRVSMPTAEAKQVLAVPRDALILRREGASVFRVLEDMTVEQVSVITGLGAGAYIEVNGELSPGDQVVVRGGERLGSGMTVRPSQQANTGAQSNGTQTSR